MKIYQIRLHKALTDYIKEQKIELTNPEIARNITSFGVKIGDELLFNRQHWILVDQKIDITHWPKRETSEIDKTQIWLETQEFLLINKPFGVVCQSGNGHKLDNLEFWLNENLDEKPGNKLENIKTQNQQNLKENSQDKKSLNLILTSKFVASNQNLNQANFSFLPVHRLDKNTQGLILFAKGPENLEKLQKEFRQRRVVKKYFAVLDGIMEQNWFVSNWQTRDKNNPIIQKFFWNEKSAKNYDQNAKNAVSIIVPQVICKEKNQTLVQIQILTGRMHQIRLQCQNLGFPLISDTVYGDVKNLEMNFFNPKLGDIFSSFPFFNLNLENSNSGQNNDQTNLRNSQNELDPENFDNIWDNSTIELKNSKFEKVTKNLNPREKHFFAQTQREKLNAKVKFVDKKSRNAPQNEQNNPNFHSIFSSSFDQKINSFQKNISQNIWQNPRNSNFSNANSSQNQFQNQVQTFGSFFNLESSKLEGFYNFFGSKVVKNTNLEEFENLKKQIFGECEYCLLANFLGIKINDFYLESSVFDLENYLRTL